MESIERWLARLGLEAYAETFAEHDVDWEVLPSLSDVDLEKLGVSLGHRRKIQQALQAESRTAADPSVDASRSADAERRIVTTLFCDLVGSTELSAGLDPEELRTLLAAYQDACATEIERTGGYLARKVGDGLLVYFGYPRAHEDDADRAIRAALGIVRVVGQITTPGNVGLQVRIGIATGPVVVGDIGDGSRRESMAIVGETPNLAARLQALADTNAIVVSTATRDLAGRFRFTMLGEHALKGFAEPVSAWQVLGQGESANRFESARQRGLSTLVGRSRELEQLNTSWALAQQDTTTIVSVVGEAGLGKSRLVYEFRSRFDERRHVFLEGHCSALGQSRAFFPFIDVVQRAFRIEPGDDSEARERRLVQGLSMLGLPEEGHAPHLLTLLRGEHHPSLKGLEDEVIGHGIRVSLKTVLRARCQLGPFALFLNDLHWIDSASEQLLSEIVAIGDLPLLIIATCRPEHDAAWLEQTADGASHLSIALSGLGRENLRQIFLESISSKREATSVADGVLDRLLTLTGGNPLFLEEMARHLVRRDSLQVENGDVIDFVGGETSIPDTLSGLLLQHVDELDVGLRRLVQLAAVVGRQFSRSIIAALAPKTEVLDHALSVLCERRLLEPLSRARYRFRHALVHDAIYQSLLVQERVRLHGVVAEHMEHDDEIQWEERIVVLANHYGRARNHAKAFRYLTLAGQQSLRVYSLEDAAASFGRALELASERPDTINVEDVIDTALMMARVYYFMGWFKRVIGFVDQYVVLAERLGDDRRLARLLFESGYCHVFRGRLREGEEILRRSRSLSESLGDTHGIGLADLGLAWSLIVAGPPTADRPKAVRRLLQSAISAGLEHRDSWLAGKAYVGRSLEGIFYGDLNESRQSCAKLNELSRAMNDTRPRAMALWQTALIAVFDFDFSHALFAAAEANQVALSPMDRNAASAAYYAATVMEGDTAKGIRPFLELRGRLAQEGFFALRVFCDVYLGVGEVMAGAMAAGVRRIEGAAHAVEFSSHSNTDSILCAFAHAVLGEVYTEIALGSRRPSAKIAYQNLGFLLRVLPTARWRARRALAKAEAIAERYRSTLVLAWVAFNLGRLARSKRDLAAGRLFERAAELADRAGAEGLARRVVEASA